MTVWLLLALIVIVGGAARWAGLEGESLVPDAAGTARIARLDFPAMWHEVVADRVHPPLYYNLLWGWLRLAGRSDYAAQVSSVLLGIATIPAMFIFLRRIGGPAAGLLGAFLLAASPQHWGLSRFVRMYALALFLATVSLALFARWLDDRQNRRLWYGWIAVNLLLVCSHYFGWFIVLAENVCALLLLGRQLPWGRWVRAHLVLLGSSLLWGVVLLWAMRAWGLGLPAPASRSPFSPVAVVANFAGFNGFLPVRHTVPLGLFLWAVPAVAAGWMALRQARAGAGEAEGRGALLALCAFGIPLVGIWCLLRLYGWADPGHAHTSFMLPGYYSLVALGLVALWRRGRAWAPVPVAVLVWAALALASAPESYAPTPFRTIAEFITAQGGANLPVYVVVPTGSGTPKTFRYYGLADVRMYREESPLDSPTIWFIHEETNEAPPSFAGYPSGYRVTLERRFEKAISQWVGPWRSPPNREIVARLDRRA